MTVITQLSPNHLPTAVEAGLTRLQITSLFPEVYCTLVQCFLFFLSSRRTPMSGSGTTKDENHPHPYRPRRGGGIQKRGHFHIKGANCKPSLFRHPGESRIGACPGLDPGSGTGAGVQNALKRLDSGFRRNDAEGLLQLAQRGKNRPRKLH